MECQGKPLSTWGIPQGDDVEEQSLRSGMREENGIN